MNCLNQITIKLPKLDANFENRFLDFFSSLGEISGEGISFYKSDQSYLPQISVVFSSETKKPFTEFAVGKEKITVELTNKTGQEKKSPHKYEHIDLEDFTNRMNNIKIVNLDHVGFDIPWFDGVHPEIVKLREILKRSSLYYLFPSGEPWDFIMPGNTEEIAAKGDPNLTMERRPKFEIVSLDKVSTPIMQLEFHIKIPYEQLLKMFPEGISVDEVKCVWVYIKNNYGLDICMVVNEDQNNDWCEYFANNRLI